MSITIAIKQAMDIFTRNRNNMGIEEPTLRSSYDFDVFLSEYNINLQRPFCWTLNDKQSFVQHIIITQAALNVQLCQVRTNNNNIIYQVLDGKQRLNSILEFIEGKFDIFFGNYTINYKQLLEILPNLFFRTFVFNIFLDYMITQKAKIIIYVDLNTKGVPHQIDQFEILNELLKL